MKFIHQVGHRQIELKEKEIPKPGRGEVLIQTRASALCGSELSTYRRDGRPDGNMGHEAVGEVVGLGTETGRLKVGQRVGVSAIAGCGACAECQAGRYTWCGSFTFHCDMHAQYFTIPEQACHLLPEDVSWDTGVLITGDGFGVPYHTSTRLNSPEIDTIVVFGLGPIGLGNVVMQSYLGRKVIGVDRAPRRLDLAWKMGATEVIEAADGVDAVAIIKSLTGGSGASAAIEAAGVPATAKLCFRVVKKGGVVVFNGEQPTVDLSPSEDFIRNDVTAVGSWFYHFHEYSKMLDLARKGLAVDSLITHHFPLAEAAEAYRAMEAGETGKVILTYPE